MNFFGNSQSYDNLLYKHWKCHKTRVCADNAAEKQCLDLSLMYNLCILFSRPQFAVFRKKAFHCFVVVGFVGGGCGIDNGKKSVPRNINFQTLSSRYI